MKKTSDDQGFQFPGVFELSAMGPADAGLEAAVPTLLVEAGLTVVEKDLDLFDAYNADEVFLTSTSLCICPVRSVNEAVIGGGRVPGPVTRQLTEAYGRLVDFDFAAQYLKRLG